MESSADTRQQVKANERASKSSFVFWFSIFISIIVIDQGLKWLIFHFSYQYVLIPHIIEILEFRNANFALSVILPKTIMFAIYSIILISILAYCSKRWGALTNTQRLAWVLILAGGVSNVFERAVSGSVKDYLYLYGGAVVNAADIYITLGIAILFLREVIKPKS